MYEEPSIALN